MCYFVFSKDNWNIIIKLVKLNDSKRRLLRKMIKDKLYFELNLRERRASIISRLPNTLTF